MLKVAFLVAFLSTLLVLAAANDTQGSYVLHRDGHMHWIAVGTDELGRSITLTCEGTTPTVLSSEDVDCFKPDGSYVPSNQIVFRDTTSEPASDSADDRAAEGAATATPGVMPSRRIVAIVIFSTVGLITLVAVALPLFRRRPQHAKTTTTGDQQHDADHGSLQLGSEDTVSNDSDKCRGELEISPVPITIP